MTETIPFNRPYMTGEELHFIEQAHKNAHLSGDGSYTKLCQSWIEQKTKSLTALLTHSCTAAIEMAALLLNIRAGDEIIMPAYTFASTANAFVLRGGVPVFVDIREDTLNLNEDLIEAAITPRTRAIVVVHYAGVACNMDRILEIAQKHQLKVVEDAAQGMMSEYKGRQLGSIGDLGAYSFHETKNIISGEGGALLINDERLIERAEIIREKGTNRSQLFRGEVDKYTWQDVGSSYLPGEVTAAFLWAQLRKADWITRERLRLWDRYHRLLLEFEERGLVRRPIVPALCGHNAHMYYVLLGSAGVREATLSNMKNNGVHAVFHYVPLYSSPAGLKFCRHHGSMKVTDDLSARLIRLPLWIGMTQAQQEKVVKELVAGVAAVRQ